MQPGGAGAGWAIMNAQQNAADERFCPCPAGRHWGPRGAAGILPYAVARDGQAWVPVNQVQGDDRDLHPSFADAWPALHEAISGSRSTRSPESRTESGRAHEHG